MVTRGGRGRRKMKRIKGVKYMVIEGGRTLGGEHTMNMQMIFYRLAHLTLTVLLTIVTPMHLIKKSS